MIDPNVLRFNQISLVSLVVIAALLNQPVLIAIVGIVLLAGSLNSRLAVFKNLYVHVLRPALRLPVNRVEDDPRAHHFAQILGGVFLLLATVAFVAGAPVIGWVLAAIVVTLALLNLTTQFCVGCFLYFQLRLLQHRFNAARA
jgi:Domain of unknown function (DUF4395)